jgi:hypothetical protein
MAQFGLAVLTGTACCSSSADVAEAVLSTTDPIHLPFRQQTAGFNGLPR